MTSWEDLNDRGVGLAAQGDLEGARTALAAALDAVPPDGRADVLLNLAHVVEALGDPRHALDLLTEALAREPGRADLVAARADVLRSLDRWDEAWRDVERALATADPEGEAVLRDTRVVLLAAAGRTTEALREAEEAVRLASRHAPHLVANLYATLALLAEQAGDGARAEEYRRLADAPGAGLTDERWARAVELNARGTVLAASGDVAGAIGVFEAAYRETLVSDDAEALVCRAGVAGNLANLTDPHRWATAAVDAGRAATALVGDAYSTSSVLVGALVARARWLHGRARAAEALADLDEALELGHQEVVVRAVRALVLATGGWYAEAEAEGRRALDLAYAQAPLFAAFTHRTLAEVASGTGDLAGALEHLTLARELCAAGGDLDGEVTALVSAGRVAYLSADADRADALYGEAEQVADSPRLRAVCLHGRGAVALLRGRPHDALALLDRAADLLGADATPLEVVAVQQVRGAALEALGRFAEAESRYAEAAAVCESAGLWHVALGAAWWRADALVRRAAAAAGEERRALAGRALDLALPAALAAEAVRQRFPHGPLRERWAALASAPATRSAFLAIRAVEDVALAAEYVDHVAGSVSLGASGVPVERGELVSLPVPPPVADHLPYAASGFPGGDDPAFAPLGFALPPRVRVDPATPSALDRWIDVAAERYGFPVRADRAVASW
ncbi:hypothetical protein [Saccharothrix sp. Mg75]|uniref:hypothetical protein n=1 Tax=Saccharothrix sp. Mg75 TaxID=3445357 RepID=UPI003EECCF30